MRTEAIVKQELINTASVQQKFVESIILIASLLISASLILKGSGVVPGAPMDQHFVETVNLHLHQNAGRWVFQYPNLQYAGGITSSLAAGLYKLLIPTTHENLNWHFRIFTMTGLLISSFYLFQTVLPRNWGLRTAAFLIVATSGYQLLEPSSDVITAVFLNLFLIAVLRAWPKAVAAFFLALFGLGKVELTLGASALVLFWFYWQTRQGDRQAFQTLLFTAGWMAVFLLPALVLQGANPFAGTRSTTAFLSTYGGFMRFHQFQTSILGQDDAIRAAEKYVFPEAKSFSEIVMKYPTLYLDAVGVSAVRSIPNLFRVFKFMLAPMLATWIGWKRIKENRFIFFAAIIAAVCILAPCWLVIFVRMRYIAKVLPAITAATMVSALELSGSSRQIVRLTWISSILTIAWQLLVHNAYQD